MSEALRSFHRQYIHPIHGAFTTSITLNRKLWTGQFEQAWDSLRLDEKLIWIAFIGNTICILTLLECFAFKK
jgi:hypothetical protein